MLGEGLLSECRYVEAVGGGGGGGGAAWGNALPSQHHGSGGPQPTALSGLALPLCMASLFPMPETPNAIFVGEKGAAVVAQRHLFLCQMLHLGVSAALWG